MIATFTTMPQMFWDCNDKYFNRSLPAPKYGLIKKLNTLARFEFWPAKKGRHPIKNQRIQFSEYYDFDEETFRDIMAHELIHYWLAWNGVKTRRDHGKEFMAKATELNTKYGLHITKTIDTSTLKRTPNAPTFTGLLQWLHG